MALFKIFKGKAENLPLDIHEGYAYLTTDTGELYVDVDASTRKQISAEKLSRTRDGFTETIEIDDLILMQDHIENKENPHEVTAIQVGARPNSWLPTTEEIGAVSKTTTINGQPLSNNIVLDANDVGADPSGSAASALSDAKSYADGLTASDVGAIPKVNGSAGQFLGFISPNVVGAVDAPSGGAGKRVCRFVIGTSASGWTEDDCDYLCDGTDDQVEINAAIQSLPSGGGEIVILDGTYNITAPIVLDRANSTLRGNGAATVLKRMWNSSTTEGIVNVSADNCTVCDLCFDGNKVAYTSNNNRGVNISGSKICVTGNTCNNNNYGIYVSNNHDNTVTGNTCNNNGGYGIFVGRGSHSNTITGNTCNNNNYGICVGNSHDNTVTGNTCNNNNYGIYVSNSHDNTVTGNTCNNNGGYGIFVGSSHSNTITGNTCNNNVIGVYVSSFSSNNTVTCNTCLRGAGTTSDYASSQYTIKVLDKNNLVACNNCMGKAPVDEGTGNTLVNNKYE